MLMIIAALVALPPLLSIARAVRLYVPAAALVQSNEYGAVVSVISRVVPW